MTELDYKKEYLEIAMVVSKAFPTCTVTTTDMVRLLMEQVKELRMAVGLPSFAIMREMEDEEYE